VALKISKPKMNLLRNFICNFGYIYNIQMIMQVQCWKWINIQFEINCDMKKHSLSSNVRNSKYNVVHNITQM
jgi:hypothetical protein